MALEENIPTPGIEPGPPAWKAGILTTRPYGTGQVLGHQSLFQQGEKDYIFLDTSPNKLLNDWIEIQL